MQIGDLICEGMERGKRLIDEQAQRFPRLVEEMVRQEGKACNKMYVEAIPGDPGVYMISVKETGEIIYVGETNNLRKRLAREHFKERKMRSQLRRNIAKTMLGDKSCDEKRITNFLGQCEFRFVRNGTDRKQFETFLIKLTNPRLNKPE